MFLFTIGYIVLKIVNDIIFWQLISTLVVLSATCSTINLLVAPLYVVYRKVGGAIGCGLAGSPIGRRPYPGLKGAKGLKVL